MKSSLQEYYEHLVSTQSDSIQRYLGKNGLLECKKAFAHLSESEKDVIINGYEKNIEIRADYIFLKLRKRYKERQPVSYDMTTTPKKRTYLIEFTPLKVKLKHSDFLRLQSIYQQRLSRPSQQFLSSHGIHGIEQMIPYVVGKQSVAALLKECYGSKTRSEIYETLKVLRSEVEKNKNVASTSFSSKKSSEGGDNYMNLSEEQDNESLKNGCEDCLVHKKTHSEELHVLFDRWYNQLSVRAQHVLELNGSSDCESFCLQIEKKGFSFKKFRHCGRKTADELELMAKDFRQLMSDNNSGHSGVDETDLQEILNTRLACTDLSVRAKNCLSGAKIWTLGDLVSLDKSSIMAIKDLGNKTFHELESFVQKQNLYFGYTNNKSNNDYSFDIVLNDPIIKNLGLSTDEKEFVLFFLDKYGFRPMICLFVKSIHSARRLREIELFVIEDIFGIREHDELKGIPEERLRYIYGCAEKTLKNDTAIKTLCTFGDWENYGVYNLPPCSWLCKGESKLESMCRCEADELFNYRIEQQKNEKDPSLFNLELTDSLSSYSELVLQFFGMITFWVNNNTSEMGRYNSYDSSDWISSISIKNRFCSFKFNKALKEVLRFSKLKTEENVNISIRSFFVENEEYWGKTINLLDAEKDAMEEVLSALFKNVCNVKVRDGNIVIRINKMNYSERLYEILRISGTRLHRDELFKRLKEVCYEKGFYDFNQTDSSQITPFLTRDSRIMPYGKSGFWGLKEWGKQSGSIRELSIRIVKKQKRPIHIDDLMKLVLELRPDSNEKSICSVIRQTAANGELLLFYDDYIGYPTACYVGDYIVMPQTFDEWIQAFKTFVEENKRFPYSSQDGYEGYLYRWHYRASQLTDLTSDEIVKIDVLNKELSHYPHNATENKFLHNCNLYKRFVEGNNRMLKESDDHELFKWFYSASREYSTYNDNRNAYFSQLLQFLSSKLY